MIQITVIVGLPGSGKTTLATSMLDDDTTLIDDLSRDPSRMDEFCLAPTKKLIITDPVVISRQAIREKIDQWMVGLEHTVTVIAFENKPQQCFENVTSRGDRRIILWDTIRRLSERYHPEAYDKMVPVYIPQ